ncbi:hypothetical protein IAT38_005575 [Cryptococcus sp. DSM 104549]
MTDKDTPERQHYTTDSKWNPGAHGADRVLLSSDGVKFHVPKIRLQCASQVFWDLLCDPPPGEDNILEMVDPALETSTMIRCLLNFYDGTWRPEHPAISLAHCSTLLSLADKWGCFLFYNALLHSISSVYLVLPPTCPLDDILPLIPLMIAAEKGETEMWADIVAHQSGRHSWYGAATNSKFHSSTNYSIFDPKGWHIAAFPRVLPVYMWALLRTFKHYGMNRVPIPAESEDIKAVVLGLVDRAEQDMRARKTPRNGRESSVLPMDDKWNFARTGAQYVLVSSDEVEFKVSRTLLRNNSPKLLEAIKSQGRRLSFSDTTFETSPTIRHVLDFCDKTWAPSTSRSLDYPLIWTLMEFAHKWDIGPLYNSLLPNVAKYYRRTLVPLNVEDVKPFLMLARHGQLDSSVVAFSKAAVTWSAEGAGGDTDATAGYSFLDPKGWPLELFELCPPVYLWALLKVMNPYGARTPVQEDRKWLKGQFMVAVRDGEQYLAAMPIVVEE